MTMSLAIYSQMRMIRHEIRPGVVWSGRAARELCLSKHPAKPPAKPKDPCGERPDIPTNPLWHMGMAQTGNASSFRLLQSSVDWLTCQGKRGKPFDKDSKEFMHDLFEAFSTGGTAKRWPEAAKLADQYVNGKGARVALNPYIYQTSVIVQDTSVAMKNVIRESRKKDVKSMSLLSTDTAFRNSSYAMPLRISSRSQLLKGVLLKDGALLTEQNNSRLKNADNRFILQSQIQYLEGGKHSTRWLVESKYDFEPFRVGHVTDIPLAGNTLKVPDGLSEYLTHSHIGVAQIFYYSASWHEVW